MSTHSEQINATYGGFGGNGTLWYMMALGAGLVPALAVGIFYIFGCGIPGFACHPWFVRRVNPLCIGCYRSIGRMEIVFLPPGGVCDLPRCVWLGFYQRLRRLHCPQAQGVKILRGSDP